MGETAALVGGVASAVRYAGVLAVWFGVLLWRPAVALQLMRERRADSSRACSGLDVWIRVDFAPEQSALHLLVLERRRRRRLAPAALSSWEPRPAWLRWS